MGRAGAGVLLRDPDCSARCSIFAQPLPVAMVTEVSGASPLHTARQGTCQVLPALRMLLSPVRMLIPRVRREVTAGAACR